MNREMKWAYALLEYTDNKKDITCPSCGKKDVKCEFHKNVDDDMGCAICKCPDCGDYFVMSRMRVPEWVDAIED